MREAETIHVTDMHTAGEPVRIISNGYPELIGETILEKRRYAREHYDHMRRRLMLEPRGHGEMYGAILTEPSIPEADAAVLFMHNSGYSTMCGHATIALGRYLIDEGVVEANAPQTVFTLECPCGPVKVTVKIEDGVPGDVSFESVPSYAERLDAVVTVPGVGEVKYDIGYGGAYYALFPASALGMDLLQTPANDLYQAGVKLVETLRKEIKITNPDDPDLGFLYGAIITDEEEGGALRPRTRNLCIFGDGQIDRSPTGSGVSARIGVDVARGRMKLGEAREFAGYANVPFTGEAVLETDKGVIVRVSGCAFYSGRSEFIAEAGDPLKDGFGLVKTMGEL